MWLAACERGEKQTEVSTPRDAHMAHVPPSVHWVATAGPLGVLQRDHVALRHPVDQRVHHHRSHGGWAGGWGRRGVGAVGGAQGVAVDR